MTVNTHCCYYSDDLADGAFRLHVAGRYPKMTALDWRVVDAAYEKLSASRGGSAKCRMNAQSPTVERHSRSGVRAVEGCSRYPYNAASTANEAARATAAKRSPGLTITSKE